MRTSPTRIEINTGFYKKAPIERRQLTSNKKLYSHFTTIFFHIRTVHLNIITIFIYSQTEALVSCLKNNINIYIKMYIKKQLRHVSVLQLHRHLLPNNAKNIHQ